MRFFPLLVLALTACDEQATYTIERCEIQILDVAPSVVQADESVTIIGYPFTTIWDTVVALNGSETEVVSIERSNCNDCDSCREINACSPCNDCDQCDLICKSECTESLDFIVPTDVMTPGSLQISNSYGQSQQIPIDIVAEEPAE